MGVRIRRAFDEAAMRSPRGHLSLLPLATLVSPLLSQLKFNGGVSSSSNSNGNSPSASRNTNRPTDVDEKFFFGGDTPSLTGNQALDGGQQSQGYSCGRRKRQANFGGSQASGGQELDG